MASASTNQPNTTLYLNNLNDKVTKMELVTQLYALFTTYGKIIDIVASKSKSMRGQAFLVFADLASATTAMRACEGMVFYDKPIHIKYAKTKSYATLRREDPEFVSPSMITGSASISMQNLRVSDSQQQLKKRPREDENATEEPKKKKEKQEGDDSDEEMEIEDDDDEEDQTPPDVNLVAGAVPPTSSQPTARLLCTNLPPEVDSSVLSILFQQYNGFHTTHVVATTDPQLKMGQATFKNATLAAAAQKALDGYSLKKGWKLGVAFM
jgi:U2 small nuclear ribonucleoprotein B''